jgi:hypothetical protein
MGRMGRVNRMLGIVHKKSSGRLAVISDLFRNPGVNLAFGPNDVLFSDLHRLGKAAIRHAPMDVQPLATAAAQHFRQSQQCFMFHSLISNEMSCYRYSEICKKTNTLFSSNNPLI